MGLPRTQYDDERTCKCGGVIYAGVHSNICRKCDRERKKRDSRNRQANRYGLTLGQLADMREAQRDRCAICGERKKLVVDHCHDSNKVRGLLCYGCNTGLGLFNDNRNGEIEASLEYLRNTLDLVIEE